jgi:hypothetical protein
MGYLTFQGSNCGKKYKKAQKCNGHRRRFPRIRGTDVMGKAPRAVHHHGTEVLGCHPLTRPGQDGSWCRKIAAAASVTVVP